MLLFLDSPNGRNDNVSISTQDEIKSLYSLDQ